MDAAIRRETPADYSEAENLTREAFWNVYRPGAVEHFLLHRYRALPDFVPELEAQTLGVYYRASCGS